MAYLIEVMVPANLISLCCSWHKAEEATTDKHYCLRDTDPERLKKIIQIVKAAGPNQIRVRLRDSRTPNRAFMDDLVMWNANPKHKPIDPEDLVKQISFSNYNKSFIGTFGPDKGKELHAFEHVTYPGAFPGEEYYVKLITPEEGQPIDVVSLHRTDDKFFDPANSQKTTSLSTYELDGPAKRRLREWQRKNRK